MLELKYVDKRYPASPSKLYVNELAIPAGEIVGILGENGSGKTTLLKTIMGLGEIQGGEVRIDGRPVTEQFDRIAFITEEGSFLPNLNPVQYGRWLGEFFPRFDPAYYAELLYDYELPVSRKMRTFSKGQKLQLEICAGLAKRADYLILDEPFVGKDIFIRQESIKRLISSLNGGETVLLSTHLIDEIENVIDRAVILDKGLVGADVYMDEIRERGRSLAELMAEVRHSRPKIRMSWPT
ncbi:ATP-binding cassette domain-containing protein [Cohnella thailandensis]|uniref:ABC transporter ATP-binding protein n=1 Tax=Cohnella thailandensis TaxID=557557 RepID=A0A841T971_9BACL|nr:ABC transporter ATP-binding protein [Cohnella thailandensis]MBB6637751.1 ABC transporter ATP-binding protein [Cohnella thailandensis]MBP1974072.1 ABC-2 type transport system ATP-binding protein [Cohnella thailandensis]